MKKLVKTLLVCGFASAMTVTTVVGQFFITVDELGNGRVNSSIPGGVVFPSTTGVDPISGLTTLVYGPATVGGNPIPSTAGDVLLIESGTQASDLIRFDGTGRLFFFSDIEAGDLNDPADVGLPAAINPIILNENGPEGNNGAFYGPQPGQPGYVPGLPNQLLANYNFISDAPAVPEPSTLALFGLAGGLLTLFWRQRSGRA